MHVQTEGKIKNNSYQHYDGLPNILLFLLLVPWDFRPSVCISSLKPNQLH